MFTILDYSSALEYSIIRRYTNIVYYYYYYTAGQHKRDQKQTRGAQTAYSRQTCIYHNNSGNQAHL